MAAKIKVDQIESVDGSANITLNNSITMASGKTLPAASLTGNLPAISGAALTGISHAPEGTAVLSTGESGGNKFLREDGDGTSSWQTAGINASDLTTGTLPIARIANDAIDSQHYAAGSVDAEHLAANSVDSAAYVDGSIDTAHFAAGSVDAAAMGANSVDSSELVDGSVDTSHLSADCVTGAKIADDAVESEHIAAAAVDLAHLSNLGDLSSKAISHCGIDSGDYIYWLANNYTDFFVDGNREFRMDADGDFHADADVIAYSTSVSDATLKYNINPVEFALDKIKQLNGVTFNYFKGNKASAGLLAQDVEKVMPSAVQEKKIPLHTDDDKAYKTLHYDSVTAILVEAIKELTAKVEKLENK